MKNVFVVMIMSLVLFLVGLFLVAFYPCCYIEYLFTFNKDKKELRRQILSKMRNMIYYSFTMDYFEVVKNVDESIELIEQIDKIKD